jgi:Tol biopolymer transport system component
VRVSVDSAGGQADDFDAVANPRVTRGSFGALVSGSGRYVAFASNAADLVPGPDTDGALDAFVHDLRSGRTEAVVIRDEPGDRETFPVDISADGRFVLVVSNFHLYLEDRERDRTTRVGADVPAGPDAGISTAALSADGRRVAFQVSDPAGPGRVFLTDLRRGTTALVGLGPSGELVDTWGSVALSGDGRTVAFGGNDNPRITLYVRDLRLGVTRLVASNSSGAALTYDGSEVAYSVGRPGIPFTQVEVADTATWEVVASVPRAGGAALSADGRFLGFDLADGVTLSVYRLDRRTGTIVRVSVNQAGQQPNNASFLPDLSADGRTVAFLSVASDLVPGDTNGVQDVFASHISGH